MRDTKGAPRQPLTVIAASVVAIAISAAGIAPVATAGDIDNQPNGPGLSLMLEESALPRPPRPEPAGGPEAVEPLQQYCTVIANGSLMCIPIQQRPGRNAPPPPANPVTGLTDPERDYVNTHYGSVCAALDAQPSYDGVMSISRVIAADGFGPGEVARIINASVYEHCAQHWPMLDAIGGAARRG